MRRNKEDCLLVITIFLLCTVLIINFVSGVLDMRADRQADPKPSHPHHRPITDAWAAGYQRGLADGIDSCGRGSGAGLHDSALYGTPVRPEDTYTYSAAELLHEISQP